MKPKDSGTTNDSHQFARNTVLSTIETLRIPPKQNEVTFDLNTASRNAWLWYLEFERRRSNREIRTHYKDIPKRRRKLIKENTTNNVRKKHGCLKRFLFHADEELSSLRDRFMCVLILYISSLINIETMKWKLIMMGHEIPDDHDYFKSKKGAGDRRRSNGNHSTGLAMTPIEEDENSCTPQALFEENKRARIHLMRVSFLYSLLLQRVGKKFRGDQLGESRFYEGLTRVCIHICVNQFDNKEVHGLIRNEVMQLFRTTNFVDNHKTIVNKKFIPTKDLMRGGGTQSSIMKQVLKFSPDRKIKFCSKRSPLIKVIYPKHLSDIGKFRSKFKITQECIRIMHKRAQLDRIKQKHGGEGRDNSSTPGAGGIRKGLGEVSDQESGKLRVEVKMQDLQKQMTDLEKIMSGVRKRIENGNEIDRSLEFKRRATKNRKHQTVGGAGSRIRFRLRNHVRDRRSMRTTAGAGQDSQLRLPRIGRRKSSRYNVGNYDLKKTSNQFVRRLSVNTRAAKAKKSKSPLSPSPSSPANLSILSINRNSKAANRKKKSPLSPVRGGKINFRTTQ